MESEASQQPKQERSRTRWTPALDKVFADLVVKQIQQGNRPNNVFDKKTWNSIRDEFNRQTDLNFNNNQLRKHLDVLRQRYNTLKSSHDKNEFVIEDPCCLGFDLWEDLGVQARPEPVKVKDCPIYDQLCTIFADTSADGKYAQSSHFEGLDKSICLDGGTTHSESPTASKFGQGKFSFAEKVAKDITEKKKKRLLSEANPAFNQSRVDQDRIAAMAEALSDMVAASKSRMAPATQSEDQFSISNCIKALDEMENVDDGLYFAALDLFEEPNYRETFISLKGDRIRRTWLQGKCNKPVNGV